MRKLFLVGVALLSLTAAGDAIFRARLTIPAQGSAFFCFSGSGDGSLGCTQNVRIAYGKGWDGGSNTFVSASDGGHGAAATDELATFPLSTTRNGDVGYQLHIGRFPCLAVTTDDQDAGSCDLYGATAR